MKRLGYRDAIAWLCLNAGLDPNETTDEWAGTVIVAFAADMFGKTPDQIARAMRAYFDRSEVA